MAVIPVRGQENGGGACGHQAEASGAKVGASVGGAARAGEAHLFFGRRGPFREGSFCAACGVWVGSMVRAGISAANATVCSGAWTPRRTPW